MGYSLWGRKESDTTERLQQIFWQTVFGKLRMLKVRNHLPFTEKKLETLSMYIVIVNFMCQFNWAVRCPDIWSNIILSISVRCFGVELTLNQWLLSEAVALCNMGRLHPTN